MQLKFASRYAKALLDLAQEQNLLDTIAIDMKTIAATLRQHTDLHLMVKSPIIYSDKKMAVLNEVFVSVNALTKSFLQITIQKKREISLLEIAAEFIEQYNHKNNIVKATLTTAQVADEDTIINVKATITSQLNAKEVQLETVIDEQIIGGFVLQYGDKIFDASIQYDLKQIAKQFEDNAYVAKI